MSPRRHDRSRPRHEHLYWRVVHRDREQGAEDDAAALSALVEAFAAAPRRAHVRLLQPPAQHPRGGWSLHVDLKEQDKADLVELLHASGWAGVV